MDSQKKARSKWWWLAPFLWLAVSAIAAGAQEASLRGHVGDENGLPVEGAEVVLQPPEGPKQTAHSDAAGNFEISDLKSGDYKATVTKPGFFLLQIDALNLKEGGNEITFDLSHEYEVHESVEVTASAQQIDPQQTDQQESLEAHEIVDLPLPKTHDLKNYLPSLPGVLHDNSGEMHVAGGRGQETEYLLDGFEIGDPATGQLTTRMNADSVRSVGVDSGGYGAQYSHGGAAVMSFNTQAGDDHWRFGATNFFPGLSIQQGLNLGNWYPRFIFSGPIRKGRAWFSDAFTWQHTFSVISGLPKPDNTVTQWTGDNLLRAQFNITPTHVLQANFLVNRLDDSHLGLNVLSPLSTTTDQRSSRYFVSVKDQLAFQKALLDFGVAFDKGNNQVLPQGSETYVVTPSGSSGNYFEALHQQTQRWQTNANLALTSRRWHGLHNLKMGFNADHTVFAQQAARNPSETQDSAGALTQLTTFSGSPRFRLSNTQAGGYGQEAWQPVRSLLVQVGGRVDWNEIVGHALWGPRLAANFMPFAENRAKLTLAWGVYYQPVNLAVLGLGSDQSRVDQLYGADGPQGPFVSRFAAPAGLQQPRFHTTSVAWEERFGSALFLTVRGIIRRERRGLAYEFVPSAQAFGGEFLLRNNRRDQYDSFEVSLRGSFHTAEIFADYTRSRARSNQALEYTLANPQFAPQVPGALPWDAPNRLVSYGWTPLPLWSLLASYFLEYRTGFPFAFVNQYRQLVGPPDQLRFPNYLSLDLGIEKRFHFRGHVWAVRLVAVNVTNHKNPDAVTSFAGAPTVFAGGQGRAFTARLRLVGKK